MSYQVIFSDTAQNLARTAGPELRKGFKKKLDQIKAMPSIGKPLLRKLAGYYSLRTKKLRIIYKVITDRKVLEVHYLGPRRDLWEIVYQLKSSGLK